MVTRAAGGPGLGCLAGEVRLGTANVVLRGVTTARSAYHEDVDPYLPPENERGVDIAQIRRLLALTPAERIREMVQASNVLIEVSEKGARQLRA